MRVFTPTSNILSKSKNDAIIFIPFNHILTKTETVQQNSNNKPKSSNKLSMNVIFQATQVFISFNASNIISKKIKCNKN